MVQNIHINSIDPSQNEKEASFCDDSIVSKPSRLGQSRMGAPIMVRDQTPKVGLKVGLGQLSVRKQDQRYSGVQKHHNSISVAPQGILKDSYKRSEKPLNLRGRNINEASALTSRELLAAEQSPKGSPVHSGQRSRDAAVLI